MYNLKFNKMNLTNQMRSRGVSYEISGDTIRSFVGRYHHCQRIGVRNLNIATSHDVVGLPRVAQRNLIIQDSGNQSKFTIGFEIEKNRFHRNAVMEYPLLAGFENDSSCGVEGVTNILPLVAPSIWRNKVFNMFTQAEKIIDDRFSPSNSDCGGHTTIRVDGMTSEELIKRIRKFSGLFYAMFRYRLKNHYCNLNLSIRTQEELRENRNVLAGGRGERYHSILQKNGGLIEFRLPSRITSVKQLRNRYELMYQMVDFAVNRPNSSFKTFLKSCRPTLRRMYGEDSSVSVRFIEACAMEMQKVIRAGKVHLAVAHMFRRPADNCCTREAKKFYQQGHNISKNRLIMRFVGDSNTLELV
jgi:hypothetical protein